jgi:hypothetical protein
MENVATEQTGRAIVERRMSPSLIAPGIMRRVSWGAVLSGASLALAVQLTLNVLGLGIAMANVIPGFSLSTGVWLTGSTILSFLLGGWAAGRLAGVPRNLDGAVHGLIAWSTASLTIYLFLHTTAGRLLAGAGTILEQGFASESDISAAALWSFSSLICGFIFAAIGGAIGSPPDLRKSRPA